MIKMICKVLTGIARSVIDEIVRGVSRSIELRSAHNVATAFNVNVGECILLTHSKFHDIDRGTIGLIAEISGKEIHSHSIIFAKEGVIEESEMTVVRLKIKPKGVGRVVRIFDKELLKGVLADVVQIEYFMAR